MATVEGHDPRSSGQLLLTRHNMVSVGVDAIGSCPDPFMLTQAIGYPTLIAPSRVRTMREHGRYSGIELVPHLSSRACSEHHERSIVPAKWNPCFRLH